MSFKESYFRILKENGLERFATDEPAERFEELTQRLTDFNSQVNLTAITDPEQLKEKVYYRISEVLSEVDDLHLLLTDLLFL